MNAAFIVAEYNPLHNGHAYHIAKTKSVLRPDALVCVMSGDFTQRGSAAVADKFARTRMALHAGVDLVLELHPVYACSSAEGFARGALLTAASLGAGGWLSFGAECADLDVLTDISQILIEEPVQFKDRLHASLGSGKPFAAARQDALAECYRQLPDIASILKAPNNILAIEYIKAIKSLRLPFAPIAIPRSEESGYLSASDIRAAIREMCRDLPHPGQAPATCETAYKMQLSFLPLPESTAALLASEFAIGRGPVFDESFFTRLVFIIQREGAESLRGYRDVGEGLENRIYAAAYAARSYDELINMCASKRYPKSRIRRILTNVLLGYGAKAPAGCAGVNPDAAGPPYLRVLGFTQTGRSLLAKSEPKVPIITNYKKLTQAGIRARTFMKFESTATDIYAAAFQNPAFHGAGQDFIRGPAIIY